MKILNNNTRKRSVKYNFSLYLVSATIICNAQSFGDDYCLALSRDLA